MKGDNIIMSKTDKELTVEVVNTFVQSWNAKNNTVGIQSNQLPDIIKSIYKTIHNLNDGSKEEATKTDKN